MTPGTIVGGILATVAMVMGASYMDGGVVEGPARIVDGDTIVIGQQRVRLAGIDAPEANQWCDMPWGASRCGHDATMALRGIIHNRTVHCAADSKDKYGRLLATCWVGNVSLNSWMVEHGWAVAYTRYSSKYLPEQSRAQAAKLGIWAGSFTMPEEWRHPNVR